MRPETLARSFVAAAAAFLVAGCAGIEAARMALPESLQGVEPVPVRGLGAGRSGDWRIDGAEALAGRFERGADRVRWFDRLQTDRVGASYTLRDAGGGERRVRCRGGQATAGWGIVEVPLRPWGVSCRWDDGAELTLAATGHATRDERAGRFRHGATMLTLRSVHRVQGSPLALDAPIGYLLLDGDRAVGAIELNGTVPRLWRPPAGTPLSRPVTEAALALALIWDPAGS